MLVCLLLAMRDINLMCLVSILAGRVAVASIMTHVGCTLATHELADSHA